ncbi:MAG: slipin family protein [Gemmatimonadetes bacterium]|nr:slipin family protein [Gemmatimonadota bacterium]
MIEVLAGLGVAALTTLMTSLRVLREYERGVVFRLGRLTAARGPGLIAMIPFGIERMVRIPLRIVAMDIPPQDVITRDNVSVKVNAVVYFRVSDPVKAVIVIQDYVFATSQLAQTTLRSVVGQAELDQLLAEREHFNDIVRRIIDEGTDPWGIDVTAVEIKDIDLPTEMRRAMARQAEAERERRAKVINAEGELQASAKLAAAARVIQVEPAAIQLRYLQTVAEIATENNSTTLFPIPIDLFRPFIERIARGGAGGAEGQSTPAIDAATVDPALPASRVEQLSMPTSTPAAVRSDEE